MEGKIIRGRNSEEIMSERDVRIIFCTFFLLSLKDSGRIFATILCYVPV